MRDAAAAALGEAWNHARFEAHRTRIEQQLASGQLREAFEGAQALLVRARAAGEKAYPAADYDLAGAHFVLARVLKTVGAAEQALPLLHEAQKRFEDVERSRPGHGAERMASVCLGDRGDCLQDLGRLDEAVEAYEECIGRAEKLADQRQIAAGKFQLATVRMLQRRYKDALDAYQEARESFTRLDEPGSVAVSWHQTGRVHQRAGQPEAAEDAYKKSLAIEVRLGNVAGQASTLGQLGTLYNNELNRPEEAVAFYRQAAEKYVEIRDTASEGRTRSNLALTLGRLHRLDEARQEIRRAIECKQPFGHASEPWKSWAILADIERDAGNPAAAAEAKRQAVDCYLGYRRDGGENHDPDGRLSHAVTEALRSGDPAAATALLEQLAADPNLPAWLRPLVQALQSIVAGSRDRGLADAPDMYYRSAAELLFLIETLEGQ